MTKEEKKLAIEELRNAIKCASKESDSKPVVYTNLVSVSRSGMYRNIAVYIVDMKNKPAGLLWNISGLVAKAQGGKAKEVNGHWCLGVSGCGMDMGYHIVSNIAYILTNWKSYHGISHRWM